MNKRNTTGRKQVLAAISKTRDVFTELDDFEGALNLLSNVLSKIDNLSGKKSQSSIRVFRDIARIAPDFQIILDMFGSFLCFLLLK